MHEVDAYRLFRHIPNIIPAIDHAIATERGADENTKTVYVLLPYYRRGNMQDMINANLVNHTRFPEKHLMTLFLGVCKALRAMHEFKAPPAERMEMDDAGPSNSRSGGNSRQAAKRTEQDEQGEQERPLMEDESQLTQGGKVKSYAHRDIKPGKETHTFLYTFFFPPKKG
jgi:serine/threonine kinase 16